MSNGLRRYKPGVEQRVHLLCAAILWTVIGIFLLGRGIILLKSADSLWLIVAGILLGCCKSFVILDKSARRGVERINRFSDNTCIGAVYSWKTWLLVLGMAGMGMMLRKTELPPALVGSLCAAIGWALLFSSRFAWQAWLGWHKKH